MLKYYGETFDFCCSRNLFLTCTCIVQVGHRDDVLVTYCFFLLQLLLKDRQLSFNIGKVSPVLEHMSVCFSDDLHSGICISVDPNRLIEYLCW